MRYASGRYSTHNNINIMLRSLNIINCDCSSCRYGFNKIDSKRLIQPYCLSVVNTLEIDL